MSTLTSFTRPADPINADQLGSQISAAIGISCTAEMLNATTISVTGAITEGNRTAIQAAITAYVFSPLPVTYLTDANMANNSDMSANRSSKVITEHAAYSADLALLALINAKPAIRYWENGTFKNGTPVTGDIIQFTDSVSTSGGNATFYPTSDHTSSGTALCSYISADSFQPNYRDNTGVYAPGTVTVAGNLKSVAIALTKQGFSGVTILGINALGSAAMNAIPDSVVVKSGFWGIAA